MKSIQKLLVIPVLLSLTACMAQIRNASTTSVHIYGNCAMCETTIEKAGNLKDVASVDWDKNTKMATIKFDAKKTNPSEILKRIALSGYDSDEFLAPDEVYNKLPDCCQYDRKAKTSTVSKSEPEEASIITSTEKAETIQAEVEKTAELQTVYDNYFSLKDALVKSDGNAASAKAQGLLSALKGVQMNRLNPDEHDVWMKLMKELKTDAENIAKTKSIEEQREIFISLSQNMYSLMKVSELEKPVYYQHCPMANNGKGANWLSKENTVKNPYYGSMMLSCGKTVETIK